MKAWHITAHPTGSTIWKTAWDYGTFDTQEEAASYIEANLRDIEDVEFHPAMGVVSPWPSR